MKRVLSSGLALSAVLSLVGCGGGGSSSPAAAAVETGTAYYLDSAVSGINYKCGSHEGITDQDGKFTFEKGQSCTFYLGDIKLREMDKALLGDGKKIVEEDTKVAVLLQSLDADGNPDNGITIKKEVVEAMADALSGNGGDGTLPDTEEEIAAVVAAIESNVNDFNGHVVTQADAIEHLQLTHATVIKELLAGKTFYVVDEADDGSKQVTKLVFNQNVTSIEATSPNKTENWGISIEGNKLVFSDDTDGSYTIISQTDGYIYFDDRYANGSKDGDGHRLYVNKADAEAYLATLGSGSTSNTLQNGFSTTYLDGRTLYFVQYDDFGYDGEGEPGLRWNMARMVFTANTIAWTEYDTPDSGTHTFNYSVTNDGKISINEGEDQDIVAFKSQTDDYLKVCEEGDCNTYLFFDEAKARAFRDSHNSSSSASHYMLQESDIAGHSILVGDPSKDKAYAADHTYTSLETDENQRDTGTWSIEDGKLKHVWSNGSVEIHSFAQKPAVGVTLTNETYGASAQITGYN